MKRGGLHLNAPGDDRNGTDLTVGLARGVPLDLSLSLGACDATLDLSIWPCAACSSRAGPARPPSRSGRRIRCQCLCSSSTILARPASPSSRWDAHASKVTVTTGVGGAELDLGGAWSGTMNLTCAQR